MSDAFAYSGMEPEARSEKCAVRFADVGKVYRLYDNAREQALDVLGLARFRFWRTLRFREFAALNGVTLEVQHGERVGIVGRNGAGKTTLLKLLTGNFAPTSGQVHVDGSVQALMQVGLGFHPEFTGQENVRASLVYNGLFGAKLEAAMKDVFDFAELGDFLGQPVKTYSLGMLSRLQFAAATALEPDILVVDEMLGAGDAYFSAKSAERMGRLARSGCTLLLVSHAANQIMQFCERVIWLEGGSIVMDDATLPVIKAYEEFSQRLERARHASTGGETSILNRAWLREKLLSDVLRAHSTADLKRPAVSGAQHTDGGLSRYAPHDDGLRIRDVRVIGDEGGLVAVISTGNRMHIEIEAEATRAGEFPCYFVVLLFTEDGRWLSRHCSGREVFSLATGERVVGRLTFDRLLLGNGRYIFSAAIYSMLDLLDLSSARFYELLTRSFEFRVLGPHPDDSTVFYHPGRWDSAVRVQDAGSGLAVGGDKGSAE